METNCCLIPLSEVRRKVNSLGLTEKQYADYLEFYFNEDTVSGESTKELVRKVFHPTEEELEQEKKIAAENVKNGFPSDFQDFLSEHGFERVDEFLSLGTS